MLTHAENSYLKYVKTEGKSLVSLINKIAWNLIFLVAVCNNLFWSYDTSQLFRESLNISQFLTIKSITFFFKYLKRRPRWLPSAIGGILLFSCLSIYKRASNVSPSEFLPGLRRKWNTSTYSNKIERIWTGLKPINVVGKWYSLTLKYIIKVSTYCNYTYRYIARSHIRQ